MGIFKVHTFIYLIYKLRLGFALSLVTIGILSTSTLSILNDNYSSPNNIPSDSTAQLYSTGMEAGYGATPFKITHRDIMHVGSDGYLYASGYNGTGQFGLGNTTQQSTHVKVGTSTSGGMTSAGFQYPIDYDLDYSHSIVIDSEGKLWTSGQGTYGVLGDGTTTDRSYFAPVLTPGGTYGLPTNYEAVGVAVGYVNASMILTDDGALYGAGRQCSMGLSTTSTAQSTFTRLDGRATNLPVAGGASGDIVDFSVSSYGSYVLYENGDLYKCYNTNSYTRIARNITMFDVEGFGAYCYAVSDDNKIYYSEQSSLSTMTAFSFTPSGIVTQIRAGRSGGWGYLTDSGALHFATSQIGTPSTTPTATNVSYFDMSGNNGTETFGALFEDGTTKFWGMNSDGQLGNGSTTDLTYANAFTPTTGGGVDPDYFLNGYSRGLQSTPPATKKRLNKGV